MSEVIKKKLLFFGNEFFESPLRQLLFVRVSYFSIISERWSKKCISFFKNYFFFSYTSRPEKNSAIDGQKKGDVTSPTSSQNSEKHLTEAELKVSITSIFYL